MDGHELIKVQGSNSDECDCPEIDTNAFTPKRIAELKRQLQTANARLIAIERERRELREIITTLAAQLKSADRK